MAEPVFKLTVTPPLRDLRGRFARAEQKLMTSRREGMRTQGRRMVDLLRDEAPKRTGAFASKIAFRTFQDGDGFGFRTTMKQPLATYIVKGTRPHVILPRRKKALFWPGARHPVARVNHPGTKPNRFPSRAYRRWLPGARKQLRQWGRDYTAEVIGKK